MDIFISKSEEINKVIEKLFLVSSEADCQGICTDLDYIYLNSDGTINTRFRHEYSSISGKIRELNEEELDGVKIYSLDYLLENINRVYDYAVNKQKPYINNLFKLKDHIGLEAGRIALVEKLRWEINNGTESVQLQLEYMNDYANSIGNQVHDSTELLGELKEQEKTNQKNITAAQKRLQELNNLSEKIEEKVKDVHRDSITILGIFASIVLAFTGGMIFSSSVLENIGNSSAYRIIIVALIIGLVFVNAIISLVLYINRIISVPKDNEFVMKYFIRKNSYWIVINFIFVFLIGVTYLGWITSSEKKVLDKSNEYQMQMYENNTKQLKQYSVNGNTTYEEYEIE